MATKSNKSKTTTSNNKSKLRVDTIVHEEATRKNIPTAEYQSIMQNAEKTPIQVAYQRRNRDLDPQLVWRGKDTKNWSDLVVSAPPLYIQEKVHPKFIIDDLMKKPKDRNSVTEEQINLFSDFNGLPNDGAKTEFYQHDSHWSNRMILGDSLQVMASLAEREGLRGKVQCIFFDPPYGIKFNSNFQWSTTSRDVKDGKTDHITREPEQVKAFRDTWRDGIHSYLDYIRDRLMVARDLLNDSGSIFIQIGDENVHRVRVLLDEIFGDTNFVSEIIFVRGVAGLGDHLSNVNDYVLWFAKDKNQLKSRTLLLPKPEKTLASAYNYLEEPNGNIRKLSKEELENDELIVGKRFKSSAIVARDASKSGSFPVEWCGKKYELPPNTHWKTSQKGLEILSKSNRLAAFGKTLVYKMYSDDFPFVPLSNVWSDVFESTFAVQRIYVVQTSTKIIQRCILMATDPGDLVLDPTCGSGTTATVAEQWGRRWITIDTSRVALALARSRIMGAKYPYYFLADSKEGIMKEAEITRTVPSTKPVFGKIRQGFVYERVPHITLKSIANNLEIEVIWEKWSQKIKKELETLNKILKESWSEWDVPIEADELWSQEAKLAYKNFQNFRESFQNEIDLSIKSKAEFEYICDSPYIDKSRVRVAGPFTVESVSPHKVLGVNDDNSLIGHNANLPKEISGTHDFVSVILDHLKTAGVQQSNKDNKISFTSISPWPGEMICAEGRFTEGDSGKAKRAAIFIGPEFGTVSRVDLVEAAKEAGEADFEVLISCAFNYDARASEFTTLGKIPILKARMNADLHMADELKNTGKGNLFVIFGEPDIEIKKIKDSKLQVKINGVDVFHPNTGEVKSDGADGIACWFLDTDYNEESFFVRHAYFLGANDPYKSLKTSLKAEIEKESWESLNSDVSRPFNIPASGRIAVKVINHLGDEVMKVFKV